MNNVSWLIKKRQLFRTVFYERMIRRTEDTRVFSSSYIFPGRKFLRACHISHAVCGISNCGTVKKWTGQQSGRGRDLTQQSYADASGACKLSLSSEPTNGSVTSCQVRTEAHDNHTVWRRNMGPSVYRAPGIEGRYNS